MAKRLKMGHRWFIIRTDHYQYGPFLYSYGTEAASWDGSYRQAMAWAKREDAEEAALMLASYHPTLLGKLLVVRRDVPKEKPRQWRHATWL